MHELNAGHSVSDLCVVHGIAPVKGRDGKLVLLVKHLDSREKKGEFVDLHFIRRFDNIREKMVVARVYPPADGIAGKDVFGRPLAAAPGDPLKIETDATLRLDRPRARRISPKSLRRATAISNWIKKSCR